MIRQFIKELMDGIIERSGELFDASFDNTVAYQIEKPRDAQHGDFAVDLAFQLSKKLKKAPRLIAETILTRLEKVIGENTDIASVITAVSVAGPGFINFAVSETAWRQLLVHIKQHENTFGTSSVGNGTRILIEFVSANPTGPLTIAHGRQAAIGDTLAHIMSAVGYEVHREYYLNDAGRQINLLGESTRARYLQLLDIDCPLPEDGYQGDYITDIAKAIFTEKGAAYKDVSLEDSRALFSEYAMTVIMKSIHEDLKAMGVAFDAFYSESTLRGEKINSVLAVLAQHNYLYEKDNALWFETTRLGDDKDRVLRKSNGDYTYLVPDIAYHKDKFDRGYHKVIDLLGPDHHGYIKRLKAAVAALNSNPDDLEVMIVQLTTLYKNGQPYRMSTRAGDFISLRELIDEVGAEPTRFFFLLRKVDSQLDFDLELAKERSQDNPIFYLQYAHARISNMCVYAERSISTNVDLERIREQDEFELLKMLHEYPHQLVQTARALEPYRLVDYLKDLAALFHRFYSHHRVVTEDKALTNTRLLLCDCVRIVLRNGLGLLGISAPERM